MKQKYTATTKMSPQWSRPFVDIVVMLRLFSGTLRAALLIVEKANFKLVNPDFASQNACYHRETLRPQFIKEFIYAYRGLHSLHYPGNLE